MAFCPKCNRLADYDSYFDKYYCTSCSWRSEKVGKKIEIKKSENSSLNNKFTYAFSGLKLTVK